MRLSRSAQHDLRPLALFAACVGLLAARVIVATEGNRRPPRQRARRGRGDMALPAGHAPVTLVCIHEVRTRSPPTGTKRWSPLRRVPVRLRLLLRVSHRDRICSHVQHGDGGDAGSSRARRWHKPPVSPRCATCGRRRIASGRARRWPRVSATIHGGPDLLREPARWVEGLPGP